MCHTKQCGLYLVGTCNIRSLLGFFYRTKTVGRTEGKRSEAEKDVRKTFKGVLVRDENLFLDKVSGNEQEGKDLKEAKVIKSRVHDYYLM